MIRAIRLVGIVSMFGLLILVMGGATPANAQDLGPGDVVRLVERDIHIPAHPGPGDPSVHLRFISGSNAEVLAVDDQTGWIEVRGTPLEGDLDTGWIVAKYIEEQLSDGGGEDDELDWCPPKGSADPHPSGRLRIATWNVGNLHAEDGQSVFTGDDPSVKRFSEDYGRMRCYVRLFDPDILAVQEVDGEEALERIVDSDVYEVHVSDRPQGTLNGQQNTGFAYKRGLNVTPRADFEDLDTTGTDRLRYGARIDVEHNGETLKLMSVHLKTGCWQEGITTSACTTFQAQIPVLEAWVDEAALDTEPFIVLGDFNRRFNLPGDPVWADLDDEEPANADLTTITQNMPISCRDNKFTEFIDHIVFDRRAVEWADPSSFRHMTFRQQDEEVWDKISDHCPVIVEMWIP